MKLLVRVVSTKVFLAVAGVAVWVGTRPSSGSASIFRGGGNPEPVASPSAEVEPDWMAPEWFPEDTWLDALPAMAAHGPRKGPQVRASEAFVFDVDAGEVLYEKNADDPRPVASLTKLVSSLALMSTAPDLESWVCIGPQHYPTRSGARSRLSTGDCLQGWDVLGGALVASDNRAAYALSTISGMDLDPFIVRMNEVANDLGMGNSTFTDPSGLEDENLSTARDMARATLAVGAHPVLSTVASAPFWDILKVDHPPRRLFTTNRLIAREDLTFHAAKTGYTDTARYCFSTLFETRAGRRLVITLIGAEGKATRWADVSRILTWVGEVGGSEQVTEDTGRPPPRRVQKSKKTRKSSGRKRR